jgi:hypothetical protein
MQKSSYCLHISLVVEFHVDLRPRDHCFTLPVCVYDLFKNNFTINACLNTNNYELICRKTFQIIVVHKKRLLYVNERVTYLCRISRVCP